MRKVEKLYGDWLIKKYGSLDAAANHWKGKPLPRDNPAEGRMGFRNYWNVFHERSARDKDGVTFLAELQRQFYQQMIGYFRSTGFKGVICTSGWTTADPQYLGPIDKYTNVVADYIDRHGYVDCARKGPNQGWAVMNNQTYYDRSILRFDAEAPGKPKLFSNPVMDPHYDNKPSFISETSVERPNRQVFLRADDAVPYGEVVRTMAAIKAAGIEDVGMVTEMPVASEDAAGVGSRSKRGSPGP